MRLYFPFKIGRDPKILDDLREKIQLKCMKLHFVGDDVNETTSILLDQLLDPRFNLRFQEWVVSRASGHLP